MIRRLLFPLMLATGLSGLLPGCLAEPLVVETMDPVRYWERPFQVLPHVRGYVVHRQYRVPGAEFWHLDRTYRYERYHPETDGWYAAELKSSGDYAFTEEALIAIARAQGLPPPAT